MRRKDREITDPKEIEEILANNIICRIAFSDGKNPYIVAMNYGYQKNKIFLHSAKEGKKIKIIKDNNQVCFEITDLNQHTKNKEWNFSEEMISKVNILEIEIKSLTGKKSGF